MRAASENLVPVTLELGGKSPVIISDTSNVKQSSKRIIAGKTMNAGQICLAPDYVLLPENKLDKFIMHAKETASSMFPSIKDNDDYTSVINERHYDRLKGYISEAKDKGIEVVEINPNNEDFKQQPNHKIPPTLIINPDEDLLVMKEEIFGPILPIKTYSNISETILSLIHI